MTARLCSLVLVAFICICQQTLVHGGLESGSKLIDKVVQYIWDPSALVRVWTGLDQLYQIASSYKEVAIKLITLPFRDPDQHRVHFNGRDRALGRIKDEPIPKHLEKIAKAYRKGVTASSKYPKTYHKKHHAKIIDSTFYDGGRVQGQHSYKNYRKRIPDIPVDPEYRGIIEAINNANLEQEMLMQSYFEQSYPSYLPQQNTLLPSFPKGFFSPSSQQEALLQSSSFPKEFFSFRPQQETLLQSHSFPKELFSSRPQKDSLLQRPSFPKEFFSSNPQQDALVKPPSFPKEFFSSNPQQDALVKPHSFPKEFFSSRPQQDASMKPPSFPKEYFSSHSQQDALLPSSLPKPFSSYPPQQDAMPSVSDTPNLFFMSPTFNQPQVKLKMFLNLMRQLNPNTQKKQTDNS